MKNPLLRISAEVLGLLSLVTTAGWSQSNQPAIVDQAVTYQMNNAHTGISTTKGLVPPLAVKWSVNLNATVGYPLIADGKIFVLAGDSNSNEINLYALDPATGATLWGPVLVPRGSYWWAAAAYDHGTIYVTPDGATVFGSGAMYAYDAATGLMLWSATLDGQYLFNSPPTAANGYVYTGGAGGGGTVYAVSEANGGTLWTAGVANGNNSSPVVAGGGVYVSYVCPQVYKFAATSGKQLWHYDPGCDGGGGNTPVLFDGSLYVRDAILVQGFDGAIFNASNGTATGNFNSQFAPTFWGKNGFYTESNSLTAFTIATGTTIWTAAPPGGDSYASAPIAVNGVIYIGTSEGKLLGYTSATGKLAVSLPMGAPISAYDSDNYSSPTAGLAAANGLLLVPASTLLVALEHK